MSVGLFNRDEPGDSLSVHHNSGKPIYCTVYDQELAYRITLHKNDSNTHPLTINLHPDPVFENILCTL